jgi:glycosyltransferase involved in cell wall biosynthesis
VRIVHISAYDASGGAARAAYRLHDGLRRIGQESFMFVAHKATDDPFVFELVRSSNPLDRLLQRVHQKSMSRRLARYQASRPAGLEPFTEDCGEFVKGICKQIPTCDVINLHWVAGFVDYVTFFQNCALRYPIVWTLHDMNPFTGGCHYDEGCMRYRSSCGACPQLGSQEDKDLSRRVWTRKQKAFAFVPPGRMRIVADSRWLAAEARRSSLLRNFPITSIYYGLDVDTFSPRNKLQARGALGIPSGVSVIMFAADSVTNRRKGLATLAGALAGIAPQLDLLLLSVGRGKPAISETVPHMHFGNIGSDRLLSVLYSAADVFVIPSTQEAFGQTALEAMACGTPVIGSEVGGIAEIVRHGVTGYLVPALDSSKLSEVLISLLYDPNRRTEMSDNCRHMVLAEHTLEMQARRYSQLYEIMLGNRRVGRGMGGAFIEDVVNNESRL